MTNALAVQQRVSKPWHKQRISKRQSEVWQLIAHGMSTKEISRAIGIESASVKTHRNVLYLKLGVHTAVQAALIWHGIERIAA